jgi:hypothetical protein
MRTLARVGYRGLGVGLHGTEQGLRLAGFEGMQTHCLCNIDFFCHVDYFIRLGLGCLVSIFFLTVFSCVWCAFRACDFVQYMNRGWTGKTALLSAEGSMVDLFADLFTASLSCPSYQTCFEFALTLPAGGHAALLEGVGAKSQCVLEQKPAARTGKALI